MNEKDWFDGDFDPDREYYEPSRRDWSWVRWMAGMALLAVAVWGVWMWVR